MTGRAIDHKGHYPRGVEDAITAFLLDCHIETFSTKTGDEARAMEGRLERELKPTLNVVLYGRGSEICDLIGARDTRGQERCVLQQ